MSIPHIIVSSYEGANDSNIENKAESNLISPNSVMVSFSDASDSEVSNETSENDEKDECHIFMKTHVHLLFNSSEDITIDDKQKFGNYCQTREGRKAFAKYVDNHRCYSLQVGESTFYKLAHSFALVLFECNENDDFFPAKILMNMAFTYYHFPEGNTLQFKQNVSKPVELHSPDLKDFTSHLSGSEEENDFDKLKKKHKKTRSSRSASETHDNKQSLWKTANNWLNKEIDVWRQFLKEPPINHKQYERRTKSQNEIIGTTLYSNSVSSIKKETSSDGDCLKKQNDCASTSGDVKKPEKMFLYQALRYQTIWQSLRFWEAAFFDAVNTERQLYFSKLQWNTLTTEEKENVNETLKNVTFAHLGTFLVNMKHLGIGNGTCLQFLRKQSIIGNLSKDLYQLLKTQIDKPLQSSVST